MIRDVVRRCAQIVAVVFDEDEIVWLELVGRGGEIISSGLQTGLFHGSGMTSVVPGGLGQFCDLAMCGGFVSTREPSSQRSVDRWMRSTVR